MKIEPRSFRCPHLRSEPSMLTVDGKIVRVTRVCVACGVELPMGPATITPQVMIEFVAAFTDESSWPSRCESDCQRGDCRWCQARHLASVIRNHDSEAG